MFIYIADIWCNISAAFPPITEAVYWKNHSSTFNLNDNLKINHQNAFSFLLSYFSRSRDIHLLKLQIKANLWCHLLTHPKWDLRKKNISQKASKILSNYSPKARWLSGNIPRKSPSLRRIIVLVFWHVQVSIRNNCPSLYTKVIFLREIICSPKMLFTLL